LKRSNRLVLLVGVFLAIVAFVGILLLSGGGGGPSTPPPESVTYPTTIAKAEIPLGTKIRADQVEIQQKTTAQRSADAFGDVAQVVGQIARQNVAVGAEINARTIGAGGTNGTILNIDVPAGQRAIAVQVDQVTGVGTVIKTGDYVDMVIGVTADKFPVITVNPADQSFTVVAGLNGTSVKVLIQGMQVLGTLLPPPEATNEAPAASGAPPAGGSTALNGQQEIVVLSVNAQQAELIKFSQLDASISLILRSPDDFVDASGQPITPVPDETTGVILKTLVDTYGVLPPELVETVLPAQPSARP
jgi:pilus assembly protein CpaB